MKFKLTREKLGHYAVTNSGYYEKFLEKFNQKGSFFSWNWAALFIPYIWTAYRKMWGTYLLFFVFNIIIVSFLFVLYRDDFSNTNHLIYFSILILSAGIFAQYFVLRANTKFMEYANQSAEKVGGLNGKTSTPIVIVATIVFLTPNIIFGYNFINLFEIKSDSLTIYRLGFDRDRTPESIQSVRAMIDSIDDKNINTIGKRGKTAVYNTVCMDSPELLTHLTKKGAEFTTLDLEKAVKCDAPNVVEFLIANNVMLPREKKLSMICRAIFRDKRALVYALLSNESELDNAVCEDYTLLEQTIYIEEDSNRLKMIDFLLSKGVDPAYVKPGNHSNALSTVIKNNDLVAVKRLLDSGMDPNKNGDIARPLYHSLSHPIAMMRLLLENKVDPNEKNILSNAISLQQSDKIKMLLDYGTTVALDNYKDAIDINSQEIIKLIDGEFSENDIKLSKTDIAVLYQSACKENNTSTIDYLISRGYDINERTKDGLIILDNYCAHKNPSFFSYLIKKGADVNAVEMRPDSYKQRSLLQKIIYRDSNPEFKRRFQKSSFELVKVLLENGVNVNYQDSDGQTAMMLITHHNDSIPEANYVFDHSDVDATLLDKKNHSLIMYATVDNSLLKKIVSKLRKKGQLKKIVNQSNVYGASALEYAAKENIESVKILLKAGIDPMIKNKQGYTALAYSANKAIYNALKRYSNKDSLNKAQCEILVIQEGNKKLQHTCKAAAPKQYNINTKTKYLFYAGDFQSLQDMENLDGIGQYSLAVKYIAHAYIMNGNLKKAKENYERFLSHTFYTSSEDRDKKIQNEFIFVSKIFGETFKQNANKVWDEIVKEGKYERKSSLYD